MPIAFSSYSSATFVRDASTFPHLPQNIEMQSTWYDDRVHIQGSNDENTVEQCYTRPAEH